MEHKCQTRRLLQSAPSHQQVPLTATEAVLLNTTSLQNCTDHLHLKDQYLIHHRSLSVLPVDTADHPLLRILDSSLMEDDKHIQAVHLVHHRFLL